MREPGIAGRASWGVAVSRAAAQYGSDGWPDSTRVDAWSDMKGGFYTPSRLGGRIGVARWLDVAGDFGLFDAGLEVRGGTPAGAGSLPMALALELRKGTGLGDGNATDARKEARLRFEAYPRLYSKGRSVTYGVLALGGSVGRRLHSVDLPPAAELPSEGPGADDGGAEILRDEVHLEAAFGAELELRKRAPRSLLFGFVVMPYVVVHPGKARLVDGQPFDRAGRPWWLLDYQQNWGISAFFTFGLWFPFSR